jgi:DNA replication protein DnaC
VAACPDGRCDGSGFLYDEATRRARDCSCRPRRIARRRAATLAGRLPKKYQGVSFDREPLPTLERERPDVVRTVKRYVGSISDSLASGQGLTFEGEPGTGKTTLAMLVSSEALRQGHSVAIYSLPRLLAVLRDTYEAVSEISLVELIDRLSLVELLHIDDVGTQQTTPWALEQLYSIVNERYEAGRALVITTNLDKKQLEEQIGARIVSRLEEMNGKSLRMYGEDMRSELNRERQASRAAARGGYGDGPPLISPEVLHDRGWR